MRATIINKISLFLGNKKSKKTLIVAKKKPTVKHSNKNLVCNKRPLHISLKQLEFISYFEQYLNQDFSNKLSLQFLENLEVTKNRNVANILLQVNALKKIDD